MYSKIVNRFNRTFSKSVTPYFEVEYCEATLKDASTEFADARALNLSANTLRDYNLTLSRLCNFFPENPPVSQLTHRELRKFLVIIPGGKKNKLNAYIGLCAFWTWCLREGYAR